MPQCVTGGPTGLFGVGAQTFQGGPMAQQDVIMRGRRAPITARRRPLVLLFMAVLLLAALVPLVQVSASQAASCPCSIWSSSATPATVTDSDRNAVELGVKFTADTDGVISGIRFYKGPKNTGTHTGSLWSSTGTRLATATFTKETASGWQQVSFASPVAVKAGTTYVASYHTSVGYYSATSQ